MPICPRCLSETPSTITNIRTGQEFCEHCAPLVCPTYSKHAVLSIQEAAWLKSQGIDPGTSRIEEYLRGLGVDSNG
jgi:hypothetical protein